jgi:hypothetical protein
LATGGSAFNLIVDFLADISINHADSGILLYRCKLLRIIYWSLNLVFPPIIGFLCPHGHGAIIFPEYLINLGVDMQLASREAAEHAIKPMDRINNPIFHRFRQN